MNSTVLTTAECELLIEWKSEKEIDKNKVWMEGRDRGSSEWVSTVPQKLSGDLLLDPVFFLFFLPSSFAFFFYSFVIKLSPPFASAVTFTPLQLFISFLSFLIHFTSSFLHFEIPSPLVVPPPWVNKFPDINNSRFPVLFLHIVNRNNTIPHTSTNNDNQEGQIVCVAQRNN